MTATQDQQAQQQQQRQQGGRPDGHGATHGAVEQDAWSENAHRPAGFFQSAALCQPGVGIDIEQGRRLGRVGLVGGDGRLFDAVQRATGVKAPVRARGEDDHAVGIGHQQLFRRVAPQRFGVVEVDLDHQCADIVVVLAHRVGEVVTALAGRCTQAEEASQTPGQSFTKIRAKGEIAGDEAVGFVPVGGGQGDAARVHQIDHVGAGLALHAGQQAVGVVQRDRVFGGVQGGAQARQIAKNLRQHFVAAQRAEQVGHIQIEGLPVLLDQHFAVVALGQEVDGPQQWRKQQRQQHEAAPAQATGSGGVRAHGKPCRNDRRIMHVKRMAGDVRRPRR